MATPSNVIVVPEPERGSYNPNRTAGLLLQSQALHIREALLRHMREIAELLTIDLKSLKTEGQISNYVHRATAVLHTRAPKAARK